MKSQDWVFTVDEMAELLRISRPTAYEAVKKGQVPHIRVGRRILIPRVAPEEMLRNPK